MRPDGFAALWPNGLPSGSALVLAISVLVALVLLGTFLGWRLRRWVAGSASRRRALHGLRQEAEARGVLEDAGYRVVAEQARQPWPVVSGDQELEVVLKVDFLVEKNGRRFVADAKTGSARSAQSAATRRQLLEYLIAYEADCALLVDMEERRVVAVQFPNL
jgi:hypothetical protein